MPLAAHTLITCLASEREPNDTIGAATGNPPLCADILASGALPTGDSDDFYRIHVSGAGILAIDLIEIPVGTDYDLFVYNEALQQIGESRHMGQSPEHLEVSVMPGTYYLRVYPYDGRSDAPYRLRWQLRG